jgi:hypothetical protein
VERSARVVFCVTRFYLLHMRAWSGRKATTKKTAEVQRTPYKFLASFAPLPELFVSRKGAKPAKQQWELLVFGGGYAALGSSRTSWG